MDIVSKMRLEGEQYPAFFIIKLRNEKGWTVVWCAQNLDWSIIDYESWKILLRKRVYGKMLLKLKCTPIFQY